MKKIAVTGGSGGAGQFVVKELLAHDYEVLNLDKVVPPVPLCPFLTLDLCDYATLYHGLEGCDGIVHFGGNPHPDDNHFEGADRFANNTVACFNVFNAAQAHGIKRIVWASSETVNGFPFVNNLPAYAPVDETTAIDPQNAYAISKASTENIAEMMAKLYGMTIIGLRLSNVLYDDETVEPSFQKIPSYWTDTNARRFNLWGYIDARDSARATRLALEADITGAEVFSITASDTIMNIPTRDLLEMAMPEVPIRDGLTGRESITDCHKAKIMLGFEPEYRWSDILALNEDGTDGVSGAGGKT